MAVYFNEIKEIVRARRYLTLIPVWGSLGFYRGVQVYNCSIEKYKEDYIYTDCVGYGLIQSILYLNPFAIPLIIRKEIYRLEVNIRGLDKEKEKFHYNDLI